MASYAEMVAADKLAAKKKILAKRAKEKLLKEQADKKRANEFKGTVPTSDKVTVTNKNNEYVPKKNNKTEVTKKVAKKDNMFTKGGPPQNPATKNKTTKKIESKTSTKKPEPKPIPKGLRESIAKDKKKPTVSKTTSSKTKASASNTKDFEKIKRIQKRLKDLGADIKVDGIMGAKTRAAMAKDKAKPKKVSEMTTKEVMERGTYGLKSGGKGTYEQRQAEIRKEKSNAKMADKMLKTLKMKK